MPWLVRSRPARLSRPGGAAATAEDELVALLGKKQPYTLVPSGLFDRLGWELPDTLGWALSGAERCWSAVRKALGNTFCKARQGGYLTNFLHWSR